MKCTMYSTLLNAQRTCEKQLPLQHNLQDKNKTFFIKLVTLKYNVLLSSFKSSCYVKKNVLWAMKTFFQLLVVYKLFTLFILDIHDRINRYSFQ